MVKLNIKEKFSKINIKKYLNRKLALTAVVVLFTIVVIVPYLILMPQSKYTLPDYIPDLQGNFVTIDNYRGFYKDEGDQNNPVILLIHGALGSTYSWRYTIPVLTAANYRVIAVDLKGYGFSEKTWDTDYSHKAQAAFINKILEKLNISKVIIDGHSLGANIALEFTELYPTKVDKLILTDAAVIENNSFNPGPLLKIDPIKRWGEIFLSYYMTKDSRKNLLQLAYFNTKLVTDTDADNYYLPLQLDNWQDSYLGEFRDSDKNALDSPLATISKPTLIIWGDSDKTVTLEQGKVLSNKISGSKLVTINSAGHDPMEEKSDDYNKAVLEFLAQ